MTVPPLEVLPFASSAPMLATAAFGLALLVRDGLLMTIATVLAGVAVGVMAGGSRGGRRRPRFCATGTAASRSFPIL